MTGWTSLPWLWTLKQRTLILAGSDDPIVPSINASVMARLMPNARLEILDDGHLFLVTQPIESAAIIEKFLAEYRDRRRHRASAYPGDSWCLNSLFPSYLNMSASSSALLNWATVDQSRIDQFAECSGESPQ